LLVAAKRRPCTLPELFMLVKLVAKLKRKAVLRMPVEWKLLGIKKAWNSTNPLSRYWYTEHTNK